MQRLAARLSHAINWFVERVIAALMVLLVLDVWLGVIDRYIFHWQLPWPEVLARYLMIWAALLAISAGIARREHIGLTLLLNHIPRVLRRPLLLALDILALALFVYVGWFGIDFALNGATRQAMIFDMTLALPFAAVPVSAAVAALQLLLVALRDQGRLIQHEAEEALG